MTLENFVYWLRGYLELAEPKKMTSKQIKKIREHLDLLFLDAAGVLGASREKKDPLTQLRELLELSEQLEQPEAEQSKPDKTDAGKAPETLREQLQPYKLTPTPEGTDSMLICGSSETADGESQPTRPRRGHNGHNANKRFC